MARVKWEWQFFNIFFLWFSIGGRTICSKDPRISPHVSVDKMDDQFRSGYGNAALACFGQRVRQILDTDRVAPANHRSAYRVGQRHAAGTGFRPGRRFQVYFGDRSRGATGAGRGRRVVFGVRPYGVSGRGGSLPQPTRSSDARRVRVQHVAGRRLPSLRLDFGGGRDGGSRGFRSRVHHGHPAGVHVHGDGSSGRGQRYGGGVGSSGGPGPSCSGAGRGVGPNA